MKSIPPNFQPDNVGRVWPVAYEVISDSAIRWAKERQIGPAAEDAFRIALLLIDVQNTFCIPDFELFVGGRSGTGAVDDNRRLCRFIYRNLSRITCIVPSLDTHHPIQIFHSIFLVDSQGRHPSPHTQISQNDIADGLWQVDPRVCLEVGMKKDNLQQYLLDYTRQLESGGRYDWTIWPYHALLGSVSHALVSAIEEAVFFHSIARTTNPRFVLKGDQTLTESYSILGPEVVRGKGTDRLQKSQNDFWSEIFSDLDMLIIAGQAKSHCLAWTVEDLLSTNKIPASRVYLLEDCTSAVVVPGLVDYTDEAAEAFLRFQERGAHIVRSTDPIMDWPGLSAPLC